MESDRKKNFEFKIFGDVITKEIPMSFSEGQQLMKEIPERLKSLNGGKGKPLKYTLIPIPQLIRYLGIEANIEIPTFKPIADEHILPILSIFQEFSEVKEKMKSYISFVRKFYYCICEKDLSEIRKNEQEFILNEAEMRTLLAKIL